MDDDFTAGRTAGPLTFGATTIRPQKRTLRTKMRNRCDRLTAESSRTRHDWPLCDTEPRGLGGVSDDTPARLVSVVDPAGPRTAKKSSSRSTKIVIKLLSQELKRSSVWRSTAPGSARIRPQRGRPTRARLVSSASGDPRLVVSRCRPRPDPRLCRNTGFDHHRSDRGSGQRCRLVVTNGIARSPCHHYRGDRCGGHQAPSRPER